MPTNRWTFTTPTPLGETVSTYEVTNDALRYESDDPFGAGVEVWPWRTVAQAATAAMAGLGAAGNKGGPQMAHWVPAQMEWLMLCRTANSGANPTANPSGNPSNNGKPFMRVLPQGPDRDAIVNAVQAYLGPRWLGQRLPLKNVQAQMNIQPDTSEKLKVTGIIFGAMAGLVLLIMLLGLLLHPLITVPVSVVVGAWLVRTGLQGMDSGKALADHKMSKIGSAAPGLVKLEGRAVAANPSPAGITGRPSVGWDVAVHLWYEGDNDSSGEWQQVAARHGGRMDVVTLEDDSGSLPIWLKDAQLLLQNQGWDSQKDALPARGVALLEELGFAWTGQGHIRVTEQCIAANVTLYVVGTLGERRSLLLPGQENLLQRCQRLWDTGQWRLVLVRAMPAPTRMVTAVVIAYLDMMIKLGRGGERVKTAAASAPPQLAPTARLIWKGQGGQPFLLSNQPERAALVAWHHRQKIRVGLGIAVWLFTLWQLYEVFTGG
jgi:hypothetical protein